MDEEPRKKFLGNDPSRHFSLRGVEDLTEPEIIARVKEVLYNRPEHMRRVRRGKWFCWVGGQGVDIQAVVAKHFPECHVENIACVDNRQTADVCMDWPSDNFKFMFFVDAFVDKCKDLKSDESLSETRALPPTLSIQRVRMHMRNRFVEKSMCMAMYAANCKDGVAFLTATRK